MFSGRHTLEEDEDGRVFIDRDGAIFKLILEYLRSPTSFSLEGLSKQLGELYDELGTADAWVKHLEEEDAKLAGNTLDLRAFGPYADTSESTSEFIWETMLLAPFGMAPSPV